MHWMLQWAYCELFFLFIYLVLWIQCNTIYWFKCSFLKVLYEIRSSNSSEKKTPSKNVVKSNKCMWLIANLMACVCEKKQIFREKNRGNFKYVNKAISTRANSYLCAIQSAMPQCMCICELWHLVGRFIIFFFGSVRAFEVHYGVEDMCDFMTDHD